LLTPQERTLRARIAAFSLHAQGGTNTLPARQRFFSRFDREVDPEGVLPEGERQKRAAFARKAYYSKLALRSAQSRRARKNGGAS
jgi:hypothetical protein